MTPSNEREVNESNSSFVFSSRGKDEICSVSSRVECNKGQSLSLEALRGGGGGFKLTPLDCFGFKFLFFDRLSKALAQLFFFC